MIDLITGHQGVAHISAEQVSTINKSMMNGYGSGQIVRLKDGTITDGTLSVIVSTGYWRMDGYDMEIQESDTLLLDPVTNPGDSRIDIIFVELLQDIATGVQRIEYVIVQGEEDPTPSEPATPTEPQNDTDRLILATPLCKCTVHDDDTMDFVDLTIPFDVQAGPRIFLGESSTWDDMSLDERAYYDNCEVIFDDGGPYHIFIYYASSDTLSPIAGDPGSAMAKTPKFATCNTASGTAIKVATTLDNDFVLQTGSVVFVQFDYITVTVTDPKLDVDNTGAKLIKAYGTTKPARWWSQGDIVQFVYDGTYWIMYPTSGQINNIDTNITNINTSLLTQTTILDTETAAANNKTVNVSNITQFKYVVAAFIIYGDRLVNPAYITVSLFKSGLGVVSSRTSGNLEQYVHIQYVSDTQIKISFSANEYTMNNAVVYGIK